VRHLERDLGANFAEGYRSEILPQLPYWMQAVLGSLESGIAMFVDYGYPRAEFYREERDDGTLICHYRHRAHDDALAWPGLQDITAFVDFTALAEAGNHAGFAVAGYAAQVTFLLASGLAQHFAQASKNADDIATYRLAQQVKRLTLPGEMGEKFQAMILARGIAASTLPAGLAEINQGFRL
jgi:SAM-dependent MidA family methyltransferase